MAPMKPQSATKRKANKVIMLRARITIALKNRLSDYCRTIDRSEAYVLRQIVEDFLANKEQKKAA